MHIGYILFYFCPLGTVRLYDRDYLPTISSRNQPLGLARQTPCGALRPLHRDPPKQEVNWKPTQCK